MSSASRASPSLRGTRARSSASDCLPGGRRLSHVERLLAGAAPIVAATDYVRAYPQLIASYVTAPFVALGHRRLRPQRHARKTSRLLRRRISLISSSQRSARSRGPDASSRPPFPRRSPDTACRRPRPRHGGTERRRATTASRRRVSPRSGTVAAAGHAARPSRRFAECKCIQNREVRGVFGHFRAKFRANGYGH